MLGRRDIIQKIDIDVQFDTIKTYWKGKGPCDLVLYRSKWVARDEITGKVINRILIFEKSLV